MANGLQFIDPTEPRSGNPVNSAARPADLAGKVLGLLDNRKEQADVILRTLADALRERYGVARVVVRHKEHHSKLAPDALLDEMAGEVDIAIAALGG
ncbi:MAG: hypothetical protein OEP48_16580 [Betaproteobacteria bacterium]|nr:hypothetical protein [Betaproteobacteria bacterium]MDH3438850.1 hypothetical protein [Betaproteobacteria bacterium]